MLVLLPEQGPAFQPGFFIPFAKATSWLKKK